MPVSQSWTSATRISHPRSSGLQRLTVDGDRGLGDVPPRECARAGQPTGSERASARGFLTGQSIHSLAQSVNVGGIDEQARIPTTSGRPPRFPATTGAPHAIASSAASPNPPRATDDTTTVAPW